MKYKTILFDLDGTLTDPKVGITKSVQHALKKNGIVVETLKDLEKFIGPPLKDSFMEFYDFDEQEAMQAIEYYREHFTDIGIFENELYEGISDLLIELRKRGCILAVATSKPTVFAKRIIDHFGLTAYINGIYGSNLDGTRTDKAEIICDAMNQLKMNALDAIIMIGDRKYDVIGAQKNNIESIGVSYGYGSLDELEDAKPTYIVHTVSELFALLTSKHVHL